MRSLVQQGSDDLTRLCQQFRVRRVELFGSATRTVLEQAEALSAIWAEAV